MLIQIKCNLTECNNKINISEALYNLNIKRKKHIGEYCCREHSDLGRKINKTVSMIGKNKGRRFTKEQNIQNSIRMKRATSNLKYRKKCSDRMKQKWKNSVYKKSMSDVHKGYKWTEQQRINASMAQKNIDVCQRKAATLLKHISEGVVKNKVFNTKPELKVLEQYKNKGYIENVDVLKQRYVSTIGTVDFYLPKENTLVFVDGDYWHCNPTKYKPCYYHQNLHKFAFDVQQKDKTITKKCEELGYKVIRIWESDIKKEVLSV